MSMMCSPIGNILCWNSKEGPNYRSVLCVPLRREESPIGVMVLLRSKVRPFTEKQIGLLTGFRRSGGDRD